MAGSDTTRLLVLGVASIFEPANGYQLRRELLSWDVESWAHVNPGSIYSMLTTLTAHGLLDRTDIVPREGGRAVAVYRTTWKGRDALVDLTRDAIVSVRSFDRTAFYAAMSLSATTIPRAEVVELLEERRRRLAASTTRTAELADSFGPGTPPHVPVLMHCAAAVEQAEDGWLAGFIDAVRSGAMIFADDDWAELWTPAPDDPAWRMVRERQKYLATLEPAASDTPRHGSVQG